MWQAWVKTCLTLGDLLLGWSLAGGPEGALAAAVADAFERSLQLALANLHESAALPVSLPWLVHHAEQVDAQFGRDLWRNGIEANRSGLALLLGYLADEGLLARPLSVDELFPLGA